MGHRQSGDDRSQHLPNDERAERLLRNAAAHYDEQEFFTNGCGGFVASLDGKTLTLQFILTETTAYAADFINVDAD